MNKAELIQGISDAAELKSKESEALLDAFIDTIGDALASGDKVSITGFGTFKVSDRKERKGLNPKTGAPITIPASKAPRFSAGKGFKDALKK